MISPHIVAHAVTAALFMTGCSYGTPTVEFTLPNGFRGAFVIIEDPEGVVLSESDGVVRVDVPASRVLKVRSSKYLRDEHGLMASYAGGSGIPVYFEPSAGPDTVAFRSIGGRQFGGQPEMLAFVVGTEVDAKRVDWQSFAHGVFGE